MKKLLVICALIAGIFSTNAQCKKETMEPFKHGIQLSGKVGTNRYAPKEIGIEGVWKQNIAKNLFFNGGLGFNFDLTNAGDKGSKKDLLEIGLPLQIEYGKLCHCKGGLYGIFGLQPTVYTTISSTRWDASTNSNVTDIKKTGFMIAPSLEFGGNIPVGKIIMRVGVYGAYRINCTTSDINVYNYCGKSMFGAKIGVVL